MLGHTSNAGPVSGQILPQDRPSRLPPAIEITTTVLLSLSFISGMFFWWGSTQLEELEPPRWLNACRIVHGILNPLVCALFGYLLCHHIRYGWQLKANRLSGFFIEAVLLVLILSGLGLYYFGGEKARAAAVLVHRWVGVFLPLAFVVHWLAGKRWAKKISK